MASLTLKGLPPLLLEELRADAERERRSLNQHAIHLLERALRERRYDFLARLETFYAEHGLATEGGEEWDDVRSDEPGREREE